MKISQTISLIGTLLSLTLLQTSSSMAEERKTEVAPPLSTEEWKGQPSSSRVAFSLMSGLGSYTDETGLTLLGGAAYKIAPQGLVDDINEVGYLEFQLGHTFVKNIDPWPYSVHFRWDFQKNIDWTFYALGGLGGHFGSDHAFGYEWVIRPRFGIGALYTPFVEHAAVRFEVAADRLTAGMQFEF